MLFANQVLCNSSANDIRAPVCRARQNHRSTPGEEADRNGQVIVPSASTRKIASWRRR
jgi:hypothetical protein